MNNETSMKNKKLRKNKVFFYNTFFVILFVFLFVTIGYAILSSNLSINSNVTVRGGKYDIEFDPQGGSMGGVSANLSIILNGPNGQLPIPTNNGYTFNGWYSNPNGEGSEYTNYDEIDDSMTLYANWVPKNYTVTFDPNEGLVNQSSLTVTYDQPYGTLPKPERTFNRFMGWYTEKTGGTQITSSSIVKILSDTVLYARWEISGFDVTINVNGNGTSSKSKLSFSSTDSQTVSISPNTDYFIDSFSCDNGFTGTGTVGPSTLDKATTYTIANNNIVDDAVCDVTIKQGRWTYGFTGNKQEFTAPYNGRYKLEAYGAGGSGTGTEGGKGNYASGDVGLIIKDKLYIYVGEYEGLFNGGGNGTNTDSSTRLCDSWGSCNNYGTCSCTKYAATDYLTSSKGSGATDFRVIPATDNSWYDVGHSSWNNDSSLLSRIVTAGGGGGKNVAKSTQFNGGVPQSFFTDRTSFFNRGSGSSSNGQLGLGSDGIKGSLAKLDNTDDRGFAATGGGGGGYYGGRTETWNVSADTVKALGGKSYTYDSLFGNNANNCAPLPGYGTSFSCNNSKDNDAKINMRIGELCLYYHYVTMNNNRFVGPEAHAYAGTSYINPSYSYDGKNYITSNSVTIDSTYTSGNGKAVVTYISK